MKKVNDGIMKEKREMKAENVGMEGWESSLP